MRKDSGFLVNAGPTLIILSMLRERAKPAFDIAVELRRKTNGRLELQKGTLYPLIVKLQKEGYIDSKWEIPEGENARRLYFLTEKGRAEAEARREAWDEYVHFVSLALEGT